MRDQAAGTVLLAEADVLKQLSSPVRSTEESAGCTLGGHPAASSLLPPVVQRERVALIQLQHPRVVGNGLHVALKSRVAVRPAWGIHTGSIVTVGVGCSWPRTRAATAGVKAREESPPRSKSSLCGLPAVEELDTVLRG